MREYRRIREKIGFLDLCKNSQLAAEITVTAVEKLGVDAAIIFADILLPLEAAGVGLEYGKGEGPVILRPICGSEDVLNLVPVDPQCHLHFVMDAIKLARRHLPGNIPLIGFAGAPFTMASYLIEGGSSRHFEKTKAMMYRQPETWHGLMTYLADITGGYLNAQIDSGVQAVQLFDSWVGCLGQDDYVQFVLPYVKRTINGVAGRVPLINFGTGTSSLLELMAESGGEVMGLDWRVELDRAWNRVPSKAVQGNLDPAVLLADARYMESRARKVISQANGRPGHIFNLGHGVLPATPFDNVKRLVECVHECSRTGRCR